MLQPQPTTTTYSFQLSILWSTRSIIRPSPDPIWYYQSSSPPWWWPSFLAIAWNTKIALPRSDTNTLLDPPALEKDRTVPIIDWPTSTDVAVVFYYPISYPPFTIVHPTHLPQLDPSIKCTFQADYQQEPGYSPTTFIITVFVPIALAWIVLSTLTTHRPIIPLYFSLCMPPLSQQQYVPPGNGMLLFP